MSRMKAQQKWMVDQARKNLLDAVERNLADLEAALSGETCQKGMRSASGMSARSNGVQGGFSGSVKCLHGFKGSDSAQAACESSPEDR